MNRPVAIVVLNIVLALATTVVWVPWQEGRWTDPPWPAQQVEDRKQWWRDSTAKAVADGEISPAERDRFLPLILKQVDDCDGRVTEAGWRYGFVWDGMEVVSAENAKIPQHFDYYGERVYWPYVFISQAIILLLGGGILTLVVGWDRRRSARSYSSE